MMEAWRRGHGLQLVFLDRNTAECFRARVCTSPSPHSHSISCPRFRNQLLTSLRPHTSGHVGVNGTSPAVAEAFAEASRKGLRRFFESRAEKIAPSGVLSYFCTVREDHAHPENQYTDDTIVFVSYVEKAWQELVNEGVIPEELLDSFNIAT